MRRDSDHSEMEKSDLDLMLNFFDHFKKKYNMSSQDIAQLITQQSDEFIPLCIFNNNSLSVFEAIVKYLVDNREISLKKVSKLLNRNYSTIWTTHSNAKKKLKASFKIDSCKQIPISIFSDSKYTIFESLVKFLKEEEDLPNNEIAKLLNRNNKTIWTIYNNTKKK